ncbi:MAG: hypothetical protein P8M65_12755 [Roseibacillus sp.]|nr:hypothetical protein [Roseibacillus sp.]
MRMSHPGTMRLAASAVVVFWICMEIWAVSPVMRESDQASLLEGSLHLLAKDRAVADNDSYNYDKQYLSYWITAAWLKLRMSGEGRSMEIVREGNLLAITLFALALLAAVGARKRWSGIQVAALYGALFTPVLSFSGVFLSPNMLSAFFLLLLAVMLRHEPSRQGPEKPKDSLSRSRICLVGLLAWAATAARQDALLLMPLLAFFAAREESLRATLRDQRVQAMMVGTVFAIILGLLLSKNFAVLPAPFFVLPTFVAFVGGGLGALLVLLIAFAAGLVSRGSLFRGGMALSVLLPLIFYGCVLYTPRHLFLPALAILLTLFSDRGRDCWNRLGQWRWGRLAVLVTLLGTALPWLVGVRMSGWKQASVVTSAPTLYPSTDGFWPMGAYGWFLGRLANGMEEPVDHNQRVWGAWSRVVPENLPRGKGAVLSSGLVSYGACHLALFGREKASSVEDADYVLFDERTLGKRQRGVNASEGSNRNTLISLLGKGCLRPLGGEIGERVFLWTRDDQDLPAREPDNGVSIKLALHGYYNGNDFRVRPWGWEHWNSKELAGHRGVVAGRDRGVLEDLVRGLEASRELEQMESSYDPAIWWTVPITAEEWKSVMADSEPGRANLWLAFGTLPDFMDVRNYAGSDSRR